jgi:hypothetical protein
MSRHGHLSNAAAAEVLAELLAVNLQRALLGHLSRDCNSPELAVGTVRDRLRAAGGDHVDVICATQREITARYTIGALPGPGPLAAPGMQMDLFGAASPQTAATAANGAGAASPIPFSMASETESAS